MQFKKIHYSSYKMSVIKAILFYSKYDQKSFKMKGIIDNTSADIETVSVDSSEIRDRLQEDDKFGIDQVPAVVVLYSNGQHKTYTGKSLDQWFEQLVFNINHFQQQVQQHQQQLQQNQQQWDDAGSYTSVPKPLRIKPSNITEIPSSLPSPGRPRLDSTPLQVDSTPLQVDNTPLQVDSNAPISSAQQSIISEHIRDAAPSIEISSEPLVPPGRKEVKKDGVSAAERAKQMLAQREQLEEKLEENRPF